MMKPQIKINHRTVFLLFFAMGISLTLHARDAEPRRNAGNFLQMAQAEDDAALDFLLDDQPADAPEAEADEDVFDELDLFLNGAEDAAPAAEEADPVEDEVPAADEPDVDVMAPDPDVVENETEEARLIAIQEEIRRQADEITARRRISEAREAAARNEYAQALRLYEAGIRNLPVRPETRELHRSVEAERFDVLYRLLREQVADVETREQARTVLGRVRTALEADPDHRGLQRLLRQAERQVDRLQPPPPPPPYADEEVQERREQVREMIHEGRGYLRTMDLESAREMFESVLSIEPENAEAMRYLRELHDQRYQLGSLERAATTRDMMATVRDTWRPREYVAIDVERPEIDREEPDVGIMEKMEQIVIPQIEFRQANIHDVVDFLVRASIDEDLEPDPDRRGVNIILNLGPGTRRPRTEMEIPDDPFAALEDTRPAAPAPGDDITVTFTARFITLRQALDIITQVAGLKYHIEGNVVMIVPLDAVVDRIIHRMYPVEPSLIDLVQREQPERPRQDDPFRRMEPVGIDRERTPVQEFFEQMGVPFPPGSSIAYRSAIGQLVVANTAENLAIFERILREIDVVPSQVEIEARFVEVNQTDLEEFGLQWMLDDNWQLLQRQGQQNLPLSARERIEVQANAPGGGFTRGLRFGSAAAQMPVGGGAGTLGSLMTVSSVLTNPEFSLVINALAQQGHADVLSAPKVTTRAGQEASIRVVTEYIYPTDYDIREITGTVDGQTVVLDAFTIPTMFETREVGVILSVLPEVSPDDNTINLTLRPEVTDEPTWHNYGAVIRRADGSEQQTNMEQPFFPTRTLETQISIYDGATVVMGGLITEHLITADDKIPFLGDLPLLGRAFRSSHKRSQKRNLLIFVTARLVDPAGQAVRSPRPVQDIVPPAAESGDTGGQP